MRSERISSHQEAERSADQIHSVPTDPARQQGHGAVQGRRPQDGKPEDRLAKLDHGQRREHSGEAARAEGCVSVEGLIRFIWLDDRSVDKTVLIYNR